MKILATVSTYVISYIGPYLLVHLTRNFTVTRNKACACVRDSIVIELQFSLVLRLVQWNCIVIVVFSNKSQFSCNNFMKCKIVVM